VNAGLIRTITVASVDSNCGKLSSLYLLGECSNTTYSTPFTPCNLYTAPSSGYNPNAGNYFVDSYCLLLLFFGIWWMIWCMWKYIFYLILLVSATGANYLSASIMTEALCGCSINVTKKFLINISSRYVFKYQCRLYKLNVLLLWCLFFLIATKYCFPNYHTWLYLCIVSSFTNT
jgi:hypothetical protein